MNDGKGISGMELFFLALADKTRLRLLNLMRESEVCVCFFVEVLGESQPKISRHLAYLRKAGVVQVRREGKWIHYKIVEPADKLEARVLENALEWLGSQQIMRRDYENLRRICSSSDLSTATSLAPKPDTFVKTDINKNQNRELETFLL